MPPAAAKLIKVDGLIVNSHTDSWASFGLVSSAPTARVRRLAIWTTMKGLSLLARRKKTGMDQKKASSGYLVRPGARFRTSVWVRLTYVLSLTTSLYLQIRASGMGRHDFVAAHNVPRPPVSSSS